MVCGIFFKKNISIYYNLFYGSAKLFKSCSNHAIFWFLFEIFQKKFSLLAKTFVHLHSNKIDGYRKYCTLGDSLSDLHSFWNKLYGLLFNHEALSFTHHHRSPGTCAGKSSISDEIWINSFYWFLFCKKTSFITEKRQFQTIVVEISSVPAPATPSFKTNPQHINRWHLFLRVVVFSAESGEVKGEPGYVWISLPPCFLSADGTVAYMYKTTSRLTVGVLILKFLISMRSSLFTPTREAAMLLSVFAIDNTWQPYVSTGQIIEEKAHQVIFG